MGMPEVHQMPCKFSRIPVSCVMNAATRYSCVRPLLELWGTFPAWLDGKETELCRFPYRPQPLGVISDGGAAGYMSEILRPYYQLVPFSIVLVRKPTSYRQGVVLRC